jgi:hydroxymethylpyrimidine pyrophosphatase-like HAD family hydrolase
MLEYAGLAVAMGNAEEYIKEIADYITLSNNENGVSQALKKFVL